MGDPIVAPATDADPRTSGAIARFQLPHPIATLYQLVVIQHQPGIRYGMVLRFAEGLVRFLALVGIADAAGQGVPKAKLDEWVKKLDAPGFGKLHGLLRSVVGQLATKPGVVTELAGVIDADWEQAIGRVIDARNEYAHDQYVLTDGRASSVIEPLLADIRVLLTRVQFLRHYHLGTAHQPRPAGEGAFSAHWHGSRGQEEECASVLLRTKAMLPENVVLLLDARRGRALVLEPYFRRASDRERGFMLWLTGLAKTSGGRGVTLSHPVLDVKSEGLVTDPMAPDSAGVTLDEYLSRAARWHLPIEVGAEALTSSLESPAVAPRFDDQYRVIGKLGEGAMGTVWEVENTLLGRRSALKILRRDLAGSAAQQKRFQREGQTLSKLRHARLVQVHHLGFTPDGDPFIEMELVEGEPLDRRLRRAGAFTADDAIALTVQLLEAVASVHDAGVIHRDIKPSNVLLCEDGPRLVDFGIAAVAGREALTKTGSAMGTLGYMAPEQWRGEATTKSDLYAVGRLLYELVTGTAPGHSAKLPDAIDPRIASVYERATAERPEDRFATADEMIAALGGALPAKPIRSAPPPVVAPATSSRPIAATAPRPMVSRKTIAIGLAVVGAAALALAVRARWHSSSTGPSPSASDPFGDRWVTIEGGRFSMGSEHGEADEQTVHDVAVPAFQMWRTEVTVAQYQTCVAANRCRATVERPGCNAGVAGREDHPINCVEWSQALDFARFVHGRLPSEAEWEYAARSGGLVRAYPWGDALPTCELATIDKCGALSTAPVGSHPAGNSVQGLSDLAGNVWEWVADGYHADYRGAPANGKAWDDTTEKRVARGGAFDTGAAHARTTNRASFDPASSYEFVGFRVVR